MTLNISFNIRGAGRARGRGAVRRCVYSLNLYGNCSFFRYKCVYFIINVQDVYSYKIVHILLQVFRNTIAYLCS